jgi:hypothetical protein
MRITYGIENKCFDGMRSIVVFLKFYNGGYKHRSQSLNYHTIDHQT